MKKTRWIILILCVLVCTFTVTACNNTTTTPETTTAATDTSATTAASEETTQATSQPEIESLIPFEETFSFSCLSATFYGTEEPNEVEKLVMEATNTNIEFIRYVDSATTSMLLASGDLPDILLTINSVDTTSWIEQGAVIAADDLLGEYGQDIISKWDDTIKMSAINVSDGKIYKIYGVVDHTYAYGMAIRQDWLDELALDSPVTVDEYIEVFKAFRDDDPNGNGEADEIPLFSQWAALDVWFWAYGIMASDPFQTASSVSNGMYEVVDNDLVPFFYNEHYEECLDTLASMYAEGLLDPEYLVRDEDSIVELMANSVLGCAYSNGDKMNSYTKSIRETSDETGTFSWVAPPQGPYGDQYVAARSPVGNAAMITVQAEEPEKLMIFLNWYFTEEGITITNFGEEGVTYELVNGESKLFDTYCDGWKENRTYGLTNTRGFMCWVGEAFLQCATKGAELGNMDELSTITYEGYALNTPYAYVFPSLGTIYATDLNIRKSEDVWTPLYAMQNQIIMGEKTFEDMEALLAELEEDIIALTTEANEYYDIMVASISD